VTCTLWVNRVNKGGTLHGNGHDATVEVFVYDRCLAAEDDAIVGVFVYNRC
jgi:hypothetical protein